MYATEFEHWLPLPCSAEVTLPLIRLRTYIVARSFVKNSPPPLLPFTRPCAGSQKLLPAGISEGVGGGYCMNLHLIP